MMAKRFVRTPRQGVYFTQRDQEIVKAVFFARYLTNRQIGRLFFSEGAFSSCKKRIRYLFDSKYLSKRKAYPNEPDIYFLGLRGRRYVSKAIEGYSEQEVTRIAGVGGDSEAHGLMMRHELTLSGLYVDAVLQCRQHGWSLEWRNARMLELQRLGVQPDAYLRVIGEGLDQRAFLEFTAVLPTATDLRGKLEGYRPLLEQMDGVPILWVTTSMSKLERLARQIKPWIYSDWVLLGLIEDQGLLLTGRMWKWSESEEKARFIAPKKATAFGAGGQARPGLPSLD